MIRGIKYKLSFSGFLLAALALALVFALSNASPRANAATGDTTPTAAPTSPQSDPGSSTGGVAAPTGPEKGANPPAAAPISGAPPPMGGTTVISASGAAAFPVGPVTMAGPATMAFPAGDGSELQGDITKIDGNKITLNDGPTVTLNDATTLGDTKGTLKASDLKVGDRIFALGTPEADKSLTARWVMKLAALPMIQVGEVSSVDNANYSFKFKAGPDNAEWVAKLSAATRLDKDGKEIKLSDIAAGDTVMVMGKADQATHTIEATTVQSGLPQPVAMIATSNAVGGKVKSVDATGNSFTVDGDIKVTVDGDTKFEGSFKSLADLKAGDMVMAAGDKQDDGSIKARTVGPLEAGTISIGSGPVTVPGPGGSISVTTGTLPGAASTNQVIEPAPTTAKS